MENRTVSLTTLCYLEKDGCYLMLHRTSKKQDQNKGKWIGVGGHFEPGESPTECLIREVREETGFSLTSWQMRGIITFVSPNSGTEYMFLYTADQFAGEMIECSEGELQWVRKEQVLDLNLWEGDPYFLRALMEERPFFTMKLEYDPEDRLLRVTD